MIEKTYYEAESWARLNFIYWWDSGQPHPNLYHDNNFLKRNIEIKKIFLSTSPQYRSAALWSVHVSKFPERDVFRPSKKRSICLKVTKKYKGSLFISLPICSKSYFWFYCIFQFLIPGIMPLLDIQIIVGNSVVVRRHNVSCCVFTLFLNVT